MIGELEIRNVDVMHARMAKSLIENFDLETIQELSDALALFYLFVSIGLSNVEPEQTWAPNLEITVWI